MNICSPLYECKQTKSPENDAETFKTQVEHTVKTLSSPWSGEREGLASRQTVPATFNIPKSSTNLYMDFSILHLLIL